MGEEWHAQAPGVERSLELLDEEPLAFSCVLANRCILVASRQDAAIGAKHVADESRDVDGAPNAARRRTIDPDVNPELT